MDADTQLFHEFKAKHERKYSSEAEEKYRLLVFKKNLKKLREIEADNSEEVPPGQNKKEFPGLDKKPKKSYRVGINKFFDMDDKEFQMFYLLPEEVLYSEEALNHVEKKRMEAEQDALEAESAPQTTEGASQERRMQTGLPSKVDWKQYATPIKNQKRCNSCYAFGAIGSVEGWTNKLGLGTVSLAEQEILDCSRENYECKGGQPYAVLDYIMNNRINYTPKYPYEGVLSTCRRSVTSLSSRYRMFRSYKFVSQNIVALLQEIAKGPVTVVHFVSTEFKFYVDGVFNGDGCAGITKANHSATAFGYDLTAPVPYILFKNSWGADWGETGFYKVAIGSISTSSKGLCLIAATPFNLVPVF